MAEEVAEKAYEKACEVVTETVKEETVKADIDIVKEYRDVLTDPKEERNARIRNAKEKELEMNIRRAYLDNPRVLMSLLAKETGMRAGELTAQGIDPGTRGTD